MNQPEIWELQHCSGHVLLSFQHFTFLLPATSHTNLSEMSGCWTCLHIIASASCFSRTKHCLAISVSEFAYFCDMQSKFFRQVNV